MSNHSEEDREVAHINDQEMEPDFDVDPSDEAMLQEEMVDLTDILEQYLATEDGETISMSLVGVRKQLETQNKILIKLVKALEVIAKK